MFIGDCSLYFCTYWNNVLFKLNPFIMFNRLPLCLTHSMLNWAKAQQTVHRTLCVKNTSNYTTSIQCLYAVTISASDMVTMRENCDSQLVFYCIYNKCRELKTQRCMFWEIWKTYHRQPLVYHEEGISNPETSPAWRTVGDGQVLTVNGHGLGWSLAHRTPEGKGALISNL